MARDKMYSVSNTLITRAPLSASCMHFLLKTSSLCHITYLCHIPRSFPLALPQARCMHDKPTHASELCCGSIVMTSASQAPSRKSEFSRVFV